MDDLLNEFLTETSESIDVVDVELVQLEQDPNNKEVLDNIFRLVHTIKGTCGFLGLPRLEKVAHASENVLGQFRDGTISVNSDAVTVILESLDRIKEILADLELTEKEPAGDDAPLIARLDAIVTGGMAAAAGEPVPEPEAAPAVEEDLRPGEVSLAELEAAFNAAPGPEDDDETEEAESIFERCGGEDSLSVASHLMTTRIENSDNLSAFFTDNLKDKLFGLFTAALQDHVSSAETIAEGCINAAGFGPEQLKSFIEEVGSVLAEVGVKDDLAEKAKTAVGDICDVMVKKSDAIAAEAASKKAADDSAKKKTEGGRTQSIRVNVDLLEDLMNMVSELVLTRNQLMQMVRQVDDSEFSVPLQRLSMCTTELQESVMKTRMQPIGNAWAKLPRIVRDLSVELNKQIDLEMIGAETELDRQVLELVKDPLTHMVRNSADHGIELPAERLATGKPEKGTITLRAFHEGGHIVIDIADDGKGIPVAKLKDKIVEKGLASQADVDEMTDTQIQKYIFHAGFSMAKKVTNVSGRGVGMDVVRTNIEKIGGTIDLNSVEGKGTSIAIKIPLTLAIVSGMIVEAAGQRFAIPQISVLELVRASANSDYSIERIKNTPVLRLRNRLLPLVYLNEVLDDTPGATKGGDAAKDNDQFIVVAQVGAFRFGIVVDQVFDTEEIVVKPLAPVLKNLSIYSGNTILGDGTVIMILDPNGIAVMANSKISDSEEELQQAEAAASAVSNTETILVFRAGNKTPKAVPLALVARLEDIEVDRVEQADGRNLIQYRGAMMPLVLINDGCSLSETGRQSVVVFSDSERTMGLAVDEIVDIVEDRLEIELSSNTPGVVGSAVIGGRATEMIDVSHYMGMAFADTALSLEAQEKLAPLSGTSVLLIDDSSFFRNMLKPLLVASGYKVTTAYNAQGALDLRDEGAEFDLIISDIEMPGMNGFELAESIKQDDRWKETPLVALSNLASEKDFDRGREAGFNDYVAKFDRDALLISLSQQLKLREDAA